VINQSFVLLPSVSENFTATSPTPFRWVQTARVAVEMGRNYIGIDIRHEYCEFARKRVKLIEMQLRLFIVEELGEVLHPISESSLGA
jgi:hypothetical protein